MKFKSSHLVHSGLSVAQLFSISVGITTVVTTQTYQHYGNNTNLSIKYEPIFTIVTTVTFKYYSNNTNNQ